MSQLWAQFSQGEQHRYETVLSNGNGRSIPCLASARPILTNGLFEGVLIAFTDITERVQSENEQAELISELNAFAHTVAHDLKAPLTLIMGYADMLSKEFQITSAKQIEQYFRALLRNSSKMENIIDELLLFSSVRRKEDIPLETLDMGRIMDEVLIRLRYLMEQWNVKIERPEQWPASIGYGPWVEEIWANYISNAVQHGGRPPRIRVGATRQEAGAQIRFWVCDNGPGIDVEEQDRLFKPFSRLDQVRAQGHGLGLSIVQRIANRLGGTVGIESQVGHGSCFYFTLPALPT